ncbi:hypothetical protein PR048_026913 [Dryococelus australis]|uniref:Uncharacterized protein n=1 Tax=Dryococelus australis TaxID=614101 RepID=A0ABQ9GMP5_9NEOP|nr:hypothetical protein PR048_026913 [Dryococelus australis]
MTAVQIRNRCPSLAINFQIPYDFWFNRKLGEEEAAKLKIFGCQAWAVRVNRNKLDSNAESCVMIRHKAGTKMAIGCGVLKGKKEEHKVNEGILGVESLVIQIDPNVEELIPNLRRSARHRTENICACCRVVNVKEIGQDKVTEPMMVGEDLSSLESDKRIEAMKAKLMRLKERIFGKSLSDQKM